MGEVALSFVLVGAILVVRAGYCPAGSDVSRLARSVPGRRHTATKKEGHVTRDHPDDEHARTELARWAALTPAEKEAELAAAAGPPTRTAENAPRDAPKPPGTPADHWRTLRTDLERVDRSRTDGG